MNPYTAFNMLHPLRIKVLSGVNHTQAQLPSGMTVVFAQPLRILPRLTAAARTQPVLALCWCCKQLLILFVQRLPRAKKCC